MEGREPASTASDPVQPRRAGDIALSIADNRLMRERLGFVPTHSSLEQILRTSTAWQLKRQQQAQALGE